MKRPLQHWLIGIASALVLGGVAVVLIVRARLPSDAEVAQKISAAFEQHYGVPLKIREAHWSLLPVPSLVLTDIATGQPRPITVGQASVQLQLMPLLHRVVAVDDLAIENVVLPRESVQAFRDKAPPTSAEGGIALPAPWTLAAVPLQRLHWRDVAWIDRRDIALAYSGEIDFDAAWRPRRVEAERVGATPPARLRMDREGPNDRWQTRIDVAGGTWNGVSRFEETTDGKLRLSAELSPRNIDIETLVKSFGRNTAVAGKVNGESTLVAEADKVGGLVRSLHTRTQFSIRPATLTKVDLAKAVSTAGISRGGTTRLDEISGTLDTQGTADGIVLRYTNLKARSGVLTATGNLRLYNRKLDGDVAVDLVDGVVGVPLKIGGSMSDPEVSLTGGALTGAAVGSAVLPGVGTAIGARLGQKLGDMFGSKPTPSAPKPKAVSPRRP